MFYLKFQEKISLIHIKDSYSAYLQHSKDTKHCREYCCTAVLSQARLFALSNEERSRLNTVFVVSNFIFGAVGSALASFLWASGGWSYVMIGSIVISVMAFVVWLYSRKSFYEVDRTGS